MTNLIPCTGAANWRSRCSKCGACMLKSVSGLCIEMVERETIRESLLRNQKFVDRLPDWLLRAHGRHRATAQVDVVRLQSDCDEAMAALRRDNETIAALRKEIKHLRNMPFERGPDGEPGPPSIGSSIDLVKAARAAIHAYDTCGSVDIAMAALDRVLRGIES